MTNTSSTFERPVRGGNRSHKFQTNNAVAPYEGRPANPAIKGLVWFCMIATFVACVYFISVIAPAMHGM